MGEATNNVIPRDSQTSQKKRDALLPPSPPKNRSPQVPITLQRATISKEVLKLNEPESAALPPIIPTSITPIPSGLARNKNTQQIEGSFSTVVSKPNTRTNGSTNHTNRLRSKYGRNKPEIQPATEFIKINNKFISSAKKVKPWIWSKFSSSARSDGLLLNHWVRQGVEYPDYPYARFDVHLEPLSYTNFFENDSINAGMLYPGTSLKTADDGKRTGKRTAFDSYRALGLDRDDDWTQSETDKLLELCKIYELRWPVIIDRWVGIYGPSNKKQVCDLQHRYYDIGRIMNQKLIERAAKLESENLVNAISPMPTGPNDILMQQSHSDVEKGAREKLVAEHTMTNAIISSASDSSNTITKNGGNLTSHPLTSSMMNIVGYEVKSSVQPSVSSYHNGTSNQSIFDLENERQRRKVLELMWSRSKEDEREEEELVKELKIIETQIRKLKKNGGHIMAATTGADTGSTGSGTVSPSNPVVSIKTPASSRNTSPVPFMLDSQFASTAPTPTPGTPYLQSGRLAPPAKGGHLGINKTTLKRMDQVLTELNVDERPIPTKRVCDLYDHLRKGVLTLLTLQKLMLKKENEIQNRRKKLEKIVGSAAVAAAIAHDNTHKKSASAASTIANAPSTPSNSTTSIGTKGKPSTVANPTVKGSKAGPISSNAKAKGGSRKRATGENNTGRKRKNTSKKTSTTSTINSTAEGAVTTSTGSVAASVVSVGGPTVGTTTPLVVGKETVSSTSRTIKQKKRIGEQENKQKKRGRKSNNQS